jgi:hypothetical protein
MATPGFRRGSRPGHRTLRAHGASRLVQMSQPVNNQNTDDILPPHKVRTPELLPFLASRRGAGIVCLSGDRHPS